MTRHIIIVAAAAIVSGCVTVEPTAAPGSPSGRVCSADSLSQFVGQSATSEVGAEMLRISGAGTIRWIQPGMAVTMDFRQDRLNVQLDEQNRITDISCG